MEWRLEMSEDAQSSKALVPAVSDKKKPRPIHEVTSRLTHNLDALRETISLHMMLALASQKIALEERLKMLQKYGELVKETKDARTFHIAPEHFRQIERARTKSERAKTAAELLPRTFLVSFVSQFDAFLGNLLPELFRLKPEVLNQSERLLTFKQLSEFESLEAARQSLIQAEVDSVQRQGYANQFSWLEKTFSIELRKRLDRWPTFVEITERRHLFVHSDASVTAQYLRVCKEHGVSNTEVKYGQCLNPDKEYLDCAYMCLYEIGVKLGQVIWRKLQPDSLEDADSSLNSYAYHLLLDENYELATRLLEFAVDTLPRHGSDISRRMFVINLAQAYKFSGHQDLCDQRLNKEDWSACNDNFQLCQNVLRDQFDQAAIVMRRIGAHGSVQEIEYLDWPIFRRFRESPQFKECYKDIFGKDPVGIEEQKKDKAVATDTTESPRLPGTVVSNLN
jgi:hypothetical protein